jgi:hypothetical protein
VDLILNSSAVHDWRAVLDQPLDQFEVALVHGEPATLVSVQRDSNEASRWSLQDLFPGADYAVAVEGRDWGLDCRQWQPIEPNGACEFCRHV